MLAPIGQFLRMLQIDNKERSKDMAAKLNVTPVFLSCVCNGKKKCPDSWHKKISDIYKLNKRKTQKLLDLIEDWKYAKQYSEISWEDREIIICLTKSIIRISDADKSNIRKILKGYNCTAKKAVAGH